MREEPIEVEIEGVRFRVVMLGGVDGRALALRVLRALGPMANNLGNLEAMTPGAVLALFSQVREEDVTAVAETLGKVSQMEVADGKWRHLTREAQQELFRGRLKLQFAWLGHAIKIQLADFFG